jgi:flagellar hook-associated protein 1 FlgK
MSTFSGLTNALTSLNAQRYGLDVTGENIANANTPGYTRRRADISEAAAAGGISALYATPHGAGGGMTASTSRLNDPVVDSRARAEHGRNGYLQTKAATLSGVENLFDEPSDNGLSERLNEFWNAWASVANNPGDLAARNVVLQTAASAADALNETSAALDRVTQGVSDQVSDVTGLINTAATALAGINGAIAIGTATGTNTSALADQRDQLLMTLSDLAGTQSTLQPDGSATVTVGGENLVVGTTASAVTVSANELVVGGVPVPVAGGKVQGLLDGLSTAIPAYAAQLDAVAAALASDVNTMQQAAYDLSGASGGPLFSGTTAGTLAVAVTDPALLAASGTPGGNLDASVALALSGMGTSATGADNQYRQLVGTLAADVQRTNQQSVVQASVTTSIDALAQSSSGVSFDEEATNLLTYQRAYQASSRVLTTVDEMLDTLISHTGRVGL